MDRQSAAPRDLADDETSDLRRRLKLELVSINSSADDEEDAEILLDYAMDMIESGENIGHVVDELKFMEMPLCDEDVSNRLGACMTKFFMELDGGGENDESSEASAPEPIPIKRTERVEPPRLLASAAPSGEGEKEDTEAQEPPARGRLIADRAASFRSSYAPSGPLPRSSFSSTSSSSSIGRKSWVGPNKIPAAGSKDEPSNETLKEEEEHEPKEEAVKRTSLKDRVAAYQGASSRKLPQEKSKSTSAKDQMAGSKKGSSPLEVDNNKEDDDCGKDNDDAPAMSLKERMAAFQGGKSSSLASTKEVGEEKADENEDDKVIIDDTPKTLKERMAAFQRGKSSLPTTTEEAEEGENDSKDDDAPKSLKDRMSAFQGGKTNAESSGKEPTVRDRKSAYSPPKSNKSSLEDKMSVFSKPKSAPKKQLSDMQQQRMAKFNNSNNSAPSSIKNPKGKNKLPPNVKAMPKPAGAAGGGLKDRMAKYAEKAGVSDPDAIMARPKPSQFNKKDIRKSQSFAAKKPNGKLEARLSVFQAKMIVSEGESGKKAQPARVVPNGGRRGGLSMYEANLSKNPVEPPSDEHANDLATPAPEEAGGEIDAEEPSLAATSNMKEQSIELQSEEKAEDSKVLVAEKAGENDAEATSPEDSEGKGLEKKEKRVDDAEEPLLVVAAASSPGASEEEKLDKHSEERVGPLEEPVTWEAEGDDTKEPIPEEARANDDEGASPTVADTAEGPVEEGELREEEENCESIMSVPGEEPSLEATKENELREENILSDEWIGEVYAEEAASGEVPFSNTSQEENKLDSGTSGVDLQELQEFQAFQKIESENELPNDKAQEKRPEEERGEAEILQWKEPEKELEEELLKWKKLEAERAKKAEEEKFRKKQVEEAERRAKEAERRAKEAELLSVRSDMAKAEKSHQASFALVQSLWKEVQEHELDVQKAEMNAKSLEARMRKGGLLSKGRKARREEYANALNVLKQWETGLLKAKDRLAVATKEVRAAGLRVEDCRRRREEAKAELARLTSASLPSRVPTPGASRGEATTDGSEPKETAMPTSPVPEGCVKDPASKESTMHATDEGTADASMSDEADAFLDLSNK